jgi:hypothetical protein
VGFGTPHHIADLVATAVIDVDGQVSAGEELGGSGDLTQRAGDRSAQCQGKPHHDDKNRKQDRDVAQAARSRRGKVIGGGRGQIPAGTALQVAQGRDPRAGRVAPSGKRRFPQYAGCSVGESIADGGDRNARRAELHGLEIGSKGAGGVVTENVELRGLEAAPPRGAGGREPVRGL